METPLRPEETETQHGIEGRDTGGEISANRSSSSSAAGLYSPYGTDIEEDDDEEEAECRVCRGEAEPDRRLFAPCKCSGSIRFTHADCLEQWLEHSGKTFCELCSHTFEFQPLYDKDAPDVLPWTELVTTILKVVLFKWLPFCLRAIAVVVLWLAVAPWCTSWLYRMWLLRASAMVNVNFSERFDAPRIMADIFSGIILIVCIVFSFLALMSFADFLRFHLDHIEEPVEEHHHHHHHAHHHVPQHQQLRRNNNNNDVDAANANINANNAGNQNNNDRDPRLAENLGQFHGPRRLGNLDDPDSDDSSDEEEWGENNRAIQENHPFGDAFIQHPREFEIENDVNAEGIRQRRPPQGLPAAPDNNAQNRNLAAANAPVAPRNNARNNRVNPPPANNNREWDDDFEHMEINIAMDELLGLRGDIVVLFRNVSWLLAFNGAYLGLFAFIPYTLGSTLLSAGIKIASALPVAEYLGVGDFFAASSDSESIGAFFVRMLYESNESAKKNGDCLQLVDLCTCSVGYLAICSTIVLWRFMVTTASSYIHRPLMGGLLWALRCLTAIVKVSTLLLLKMVILPITLGLGIDFLTLHLFMVTLQHRIQFIMQNMVGALMIHWVLGITFMLFVTVSVLQLREVVHPDILAKVIRPQEDHPDLLRTLLSEKCMKHARRMLLSLAIYSALLVVLVHLPVRCAVWVAPSYFPLELRFQHFSPEIQVPLELLAVHLAVLSVLEHAKNEIGRFQHIGIALACKYLGLTEYLLPRIILNARNNANGDRKATIAVLPPPPLHFHPRAQLPPEQLRVEGHRYLPWPEDGLEDTQPMEYDLLPRETPTHLPIRLAGLLVFCWFICVAVMSVMLFGSLLIGRVCMGPFERITGITHEPLVMVAGCQIGWYTVNSLYTLYALTLSEDQVEPTLVQRGYCVRNMTPMNAVISVVGWAFVCPLLVGYLVSECFPYANSTWMERFWMGYLLLNVFGWLVCCFRTKTNQRRRNDRRLGNNEMDQDDEFVDHMDHDDDMDHDEVDDDDDDDDDDDEEDEELHAAVAAGGLAEPEDFISCFRKAYRQAMFNATVHDNDAVRLQRDNILDRCFDVEFFQRKVLKPIVVFLVGMIVMTTVLSTLMLLIFSSESSNLEKTSFALSSLSIGSVVVFLRSHALVTRWMSNLSESIRNERYLIGRQLQDMAR